MYENQQNNSILEDKDSNSKVTEAMLKNFGASDKKNNKQEDCLTKDSPESSQMTQNDCENNASENAESKNTQKNYVNFRVKTKEKSKKKKKHTKKSNFSLVKFFVIFCIFAMFCLAIFGVWNRWFRYNDSQDIISTWQINNSNAAVKIDEKTIAINSNANLKYTIDSFSKVINYEIGDMKGQSHYRFSWDRNQLALVENKNYDAFSTIISDLGWFWDWSTCKMSKVDLSPAYTKNNKDQVDTENTGIEDIIENGKSESVLLDKISTKKTESTQ